MKNIHELLKEIGIEIPADKKEAFEKSLFENYKTVAEVERIKGTLKTAEDNLAQRDKDLAELKKQMGDNGVEGLVTRKAAMNQKSMERELERAFLTEATTAGTSVQLQATDINEQVEELIQSIENTKNDYVDGVPRDMISVTLDTDIAEMGMFHQKIPA